MTEKPGLSRTNSILNTRVMRKITRYLATVLYKPLLVKWLSKERRYTYRDISLAIHPQVFHPGFFFSTKILLRYLDDIPLAGKKLLELGAGSGLISISAAKKGAVVTATDINPVATLYLKENSRSNQAGLTVITSDLFTSVPEEIFDIIVINPPYYFETPLTHKQYAWYCGKNGEYFHGLFKNLSNYIDQNTVILVVLCEGSNRLLIQTIAGEYGFALDCMRVFHNLIERNYVYEVKAMSYELS